MLGKRHVIVALVEAVLLLGVACHKKQAAQKPKLPGPGEAPTLTQTLPDEIQPQPLPQDPTETANAQEPPPLPKKSRPRKKTQPNPGTQAKEPGATAPQSSAASDATTASLRPPGNPADAAALAIGPDVSSAEAARDRQSTTQQLDATERDLKRLDGRSLKSDEQAMLTQIKNYISQSRKALLDGDYERASNLAKKAQLLTDDLLKK